MVINNFQVKNKVREIKLNSEKPKLKYLMMYDFQNDAGSS